MPEEPLALSIIPTPPPTDGEYDAICATVMESARGRWFLDEYARRNRSADTRLVLAAINRIERVMRGERDQQAYQSFRTDLLETATAIAQTRAEVESRREAHAQAEVTPGDVSGPDATPAPAASDIFAAAERIQDIVWTMRERGLDPATCEQIEALATSILSVSSLRDPNDHRTRKLSGVLQYLERRIGTMLEACAEAAQGAAMEGAAAAPAEPLPTGGGEEPSAAFPAEAPAETFEIFAEAQSGPAPEVSAAMPAETVELEIEPLVVTLIAQLEVVADTPAAELELDPIMIEPLFPPPRIDATASSGALAAEPSSVPVTGSEPAASVPASSEPAEPADFLLEPLPLPAASTSPMHSAAGAAAQAPAQSAVGAIVEIEEELFVPAPEDTAHDPPVEQPLLQPQPPAEPIPRPAAAAAAIVVATPEQIPVATAAVAAPTTAIAPSVPSRPIAKPVPRPAPSDPLAALRAMSDEERIALFS